VSRTVLAIRLKLHYTIYMSITHEAGIVLNRDRLVLAAAVADRIVGKDDAVTGGVPVSRETIHGYALHDLSKLLVAVIADRPALFQAYVEWQRSVNFHRDIPSTVLHNRLDVLSDVLNAHMDEDTFAEVAPVLEAGRQILSHEMTPTVPYLTPSNPLLSLANRYLQLSLAQHYDEAMRSILRAVEDGIPVTEAYIRIIQPVQQELGRLWQMNQVTVPQEHAVTETSRSLMALLRGRYRPPSRHNTTVLIACLGGELHDLGARMVSDFLYLEGFHSIFTGANTPHHQIIDEVRTSGASVVALSTTMSLHVHLVIDLIDRIRDVFGRKITIMVGGYAFNQHANLWKDVGADAYAKSADAAVSVMQDVTASLSA